MTAVLLRKGDFIGGLSRDRTKTGRNHHRDGTRVDCKTAGRVNKRLTIKKDQTIQGEVYCNGGCHGTGPKRRDSFGRGKTSGELIKIDIEIKQDQSKYRITVSDHGK